MATIDNVEADSDGVHVTVSASESNTPSSFYIQLYADTNNGSLQLAEREVDATSDTTTASLQLYQIRGSADSSNLFALSDFDTYSFSIVVYPWDSDGNALSSGRTEQTISLPRNYFASKSSPRVEPHTCEEKTDSRVFVNGTRIPVEDIDIHLRKEGVIDVNRYVEGVFASPYNGQDYASLFETLDPDNQTSQDVIRIDVKDYVTNEYHTEFHGTVTGVGNGPNGVEKAWSFRARGPAFFLDKTLASKKFKNASVKNVLQYVRSELDDKLPISVSMDVLANENAQNATVGGTLSRLNPILGGVAQLTDVLSTPKEFQRNRDTLADVVAWLGKKADLTIWLEPTVKGVELIATETPTQRSHKGHYLDGDVEIINNNALAELNPVNSLIANGQAKKSLASIGDFDITTPSDTYAQAKARHVGLYRRAGETELFAEPENVSDGGSSEEVANEARKRLKNHLNQSSSSKIETLLTTPIMPHDTIEALPTCNGDLVSEKIPITYEIDRVHHKVRSGGDVNHTVLNVGVRASNDDIEIVKRWEGEA